MTIDEWATAYILQWGLKQIDTPGCKEGEADFLYAYNSATNTRDYGQLRTAIYNQQRSTQHGINTITP
jgi:hypothetical protein